MRIIYFSFIIICLVWRVNKGYAQNFSHIKHYTTDDGLPHNVGYHLMQDSKGFLWICTDDGLARFDGKRFKVYRSKDGLLSNYPIDVTEDKEGTIWVGSWKGGVNSIKGDSVDTPVIDYPLFRVSNIDIQGDKMILSNGKHQLLIYQKKGKGWEFLNPKSKDGLYINKDSSIIYDTHNEASRMKYASSSSHFETYLNIDREMLVFKALGGVWQYQDDATFTPFFPDIIKKDTIYHISQDTQQRYWLGGFGKIIRIDKNGQTQTWTKGLPFRDIYSIQYGIDDKVYFLTGDKDLNQRGLYCYNLVNGHLENILSKYNIRALPSDIEVDREGNLWVTTNGDGLYCITYSPFRNYNEQQGLTNSFVQHIVQDKYKNIYIGTINGLYKLKKDSIKRLYLLPKKSIVEIRSLYLSPTGNILTLIDVTNLSNRYFFEIDNKQVKQIRAWPEKKHFLDHQNQQWFFVDNRLSIASFRNMSQKSAWRDYFFAKGFLIQQILEHQGKYWMATNQGLYAFKENRQKTKPTIEFLDSLKVADGLASDFINTVAKGANGELWIGTKEGLCLYQNGKIQQWSAKDDLVSNNCTSILVDHNGYVWIGTPKGLSYFDRQRFINYNHKTGLASPTVNCLFLDDRKRLWIGTSKGISMLDISQKLTHVAPPRLYIDRLLVNRKPVNVSSALVLKYNQRLDVYFQALSFVHPEGIRYEYRLNGEPWQETPINFVSYNRFPTGDHVLEIRAKKYNSNWSVVKSIRFEVTPPFWFTWWALVLYTIILGGLLYGVAKWRSRKLEKDKLRLEKLVAKRTYELEQQKEEIASQAEQLKEMDQVKSRFFANISHEFKTPLTLIIGPAEKLLVATKQMKKIKTYSQYILANAHRLMKLINQLMDVSKIDSGKMSLQPTTGNLTTFLRQILNSFELLAQQKNIQLELQTKQAAIVCDFDEDKIEKIFFNLLSNALKFTPDEGKVTLTLTQVDAQVSITVSDTGAGIPTHQQPFIFDRFYQVDDSGTRAYEGTGIGLALVKELVMLHEGTIEVESLPAQGTSFTVKLPLTQKESHASITDSALPSLPQVPASGIATQDLPEQMADTTKNTLLVVEDNPELREFIVSELSSIYHVLSAKNGAEGIDLALKNVPDLIVSDVMMPKVDGFELVKTLRQNQVTSHIPIIILSAKSSFESKITGLEIGGDDYLTKPFSAKELLLRVRNMLDRRDRLREVLTQSISIPAIATKPKKRGISSKEDTFLEKAVEIVEQNLRNPAFDVAFFCQEIGMSHSSLFRKLKALTNMTIMEFVRTIKLKKAAELLQQTEDKVEDVAFQAGFNDISYFNKCFKKQFGVTPSEYQ
ncbi:hypothetical protein BKI52_43280 [marine bacterium AO1-C]|nr:hypothetical protein BKI52_43280 [marine bacterium AO1-C]